MEILILQGADSKLAVREDESITYRDVDFNYLPALKKAQVVVIDCSDYQYLIDTDRELLTDKLIIGFEPFNLSLAQVEVKVVGDLAICKVDGPSQEVEVICREVTSYILNHQYQTLYTSIDQFNQTVVEAETLAQTVKELAQSGQNIDFMASSSVIVGSLANSDK